MENTRFINQLNELLKHENDLELTSMIYDKCDAAKHVLDIKLIADAISAKFHSNVIDDAILHARPYRDNPTVVEAVINIIVDDPRERHIRFLYEWLPRHKFRQAMDEHKHRFKGTRLYTMVDNMCTPKIL